MASITYDHVWKKFGDVVAVQDLDIFIEDQEFLVFVGPSGCGKSTSLRMLAGLEEISEGTISIDDRVVNDVPPKDRNIAMVFQSYALYPHMSVYDNMAFGLKLRKTPKAEIDRRVKEAGGILGIENLLDRKSKLHQRLETTFIYVTHDQTEAMTMGSRICVLRDGLMMQMDSPQNLYDKPDNVFVAGFIGSPAMNFFDVTLVEQDGDLYVDGGTFRLKLPPEKAQAARSHVGKQVIFGTRPEDIHDREFTPPGIRAEALTATVDVTELMGNEIFVYLLIGQKQFIARFDPRTSARIGKEMDVAVNMDNSHLFDRDSEEAIR
jgi:multiple sugar transport system ATP-binding protein